MALDRLSPDEKKKLKEYIESVQEIKKEIDELLEKAGVKYTMESNRKVDEEGGNMSSNLTLNI
jgi:molecular chaperone GrpE (heat shock protein)